MCELHKKTGKDVPCSAEALCKNYVNVDVPSHDPVWLPRLRHVMRLEGMVAVGCHFQPQDLSPDEWDQLIALAGERNIIEAEISDLRVKKDAPSSGLNQEELAGVGEARRQSGLPGPGQSLLK